MRTYIRFGMFVYTYSKSSSSSQDKIYVRNFSFEPAYVTFHFTVRRLYVDKIR